MSVTSRSPHSFTERKKKKSQSKSLLERELHKEEGRSVGHLRWPCKRLQLCRDGLRRTKNAGGIRHQHWGSVVSELCLVEATLPFLCRFDEGLLSPREKGDRSRRRRLVFRELFKYVEQMWQRYHWRDDLLPPPKKGGRIKWIHILEIHFRVNYVFFLTIKTNKQVKLFTTISLLFLARASVLKCSWW